LSCNQLGVSNRQNMFFKMVWKSQLLCVNLHKPKMGQKLFFFSQLHWYDMVQSIRLDQDKIKEDNEF
jgi:hypothetical protein